MNVGTSRRSVLNPDGAEQYSYIREANSMLSRTGNMCGVHLFEHTIQVQRMAIGNNPKRVYISCNYIRYLHLQFQENTQTGSIQNGLSSTKRAGRSVLVMLLAAMRGGSFGLETPGSSIMERYKRMVFLYRRLRVARQGLYMHDGFCA